MHPIVVPAPRRPASNRTQDIDPDDLHELAEQLPDLHVAVTTVTPHPWWGDDRCGYCPEPADALGAPRHAVALVAYSGYRGDQHVYRDTTCPGCLHAALVSKRIYRRVWVEIPAATCVCDPTRGHSCLVCDGTLFDAVLAETPGEVLA